MKLVQEVYILQGEGLHPPWDKCIKTALHITECGVVSTMGEV